MQIRVGRSPASPFRPPVSPAQGRMTAPGKRRCRRTTKRAGSKTESIRWENGSFGSTLRGGIDAEFFLCNEKPRVLHQRLHGLLGIHRRDSLAAEKLRLQLAAG